MPKRYYIDSLPIELLEQLKDRLLSTGFQQYEMHSDWLKERGYTISRSAIHRYATANAAAMLAKQQAAESSPIVEARLRCLEIASSLDSKTAADLIREAEKLLKWVYRS